MPSAITARRPVILGILLALVALGAHQAAYVLSATRVDRYRVPLAESTHDALWTPLAIVLTVAALGLGAVAVRELRRLLTHGSALGTAYRHDPQARGFARTAGGLWLTLGLLAAAAYGIQGNVELVLAGEAAPGLGAFGAHGWMPLVVIAVATLLISTVTALVGWRCRALLARIAARGPRPARRPSRSLRPSLSIRAVSSVRQRGWGRRAPPRELRLA